MSSLLTPAELERDARPRRKSGSAMRKARKAHDALDRVRDEVGDAISPRGSIQCLVYWRGEKFPLRNNHESFDDARREAQNVSRATAEVDKCVVLVSGHNVATFVGGLRRA